MGENINCCKDSLIPSREICTQKEKLIQEQLEKGINIKTEDEFNRLMNLLVKYNLIEKAPVLNDIKNSTQVGVTTAGILFGFNEVHGEKILISIKKDINGNIGVYSTRSFITTDIHPKFGHIDEKGDFHYAPDTNFIAFSDKVHLSQNTGKILDDAPRCDKDAVITSTEPPPPPQVNKTIDIKKGDTLWKIIEENYDIPDDGQKNRNIANIALRLSKLQENRGVIKNGSIFIGNSLFLPNEISTIRLPKKEEFKFNLKKIQA